MAISYRAGPSRALMPIKARRPTPGARPLTRMLPQLLELGRPAAASNPGLRKDLRLDPSQCRPSPMPIKLAP